MQCRGVQHGDWNRARLLIVYDCPTILYSARGKWNLSVVILSSGCSIRRWKHGNWRTVQHRLSSYCTKNMPTCAKNIVQDHWMLRPFRHAYCSEVLATAAIHGNLGIVSWPGWSGWSRFYRKAMDFDRKESGRWLTYPSEKYESQLELLFPIYGK